jgi:hypothetical protein
MGIAEFIVGPAEDRTTLSPEDVAQKHPHPTG